MDKKVKKNLSAALAATMAAGVATAAVPAKADQLVSDKAQNTTTKSSLDELYAKAYEATMKVVETAKANGVKAYFTEGEKVSTTEAVVKAVQAGMQDQIKAADEAIKQLPADRLDLIGTLSSILDDYQHPVYERIVTEINALNAAAGNVKQADINNVDLLINVAPKVIDNNGNDSKASYSSALDKAQAAFTAKVVAAVEKAEKSESKEDLEAAKALVEELATATGKTVVAKAKELNETVVKVEEIIKEKEAMVKVEKVSAINATTVQVTGLAKEVKEDTLKDKKITLKAGDVSLTATYVATSLTEDGKANFVLEAEKKLTDAVTYTVSADWASFTKADFVAKGLVAPYINKVEVLTKGVPAGKATDDKNLVYFTAKNQYGEDIALTGNVTDLKVKGTINGVPFVATELEGTTNLAKGIVEINKDIKEGDKVTLTFTNTINGKAGVEVGTVSYTIVKAEDVVETTISDMQATYVNGPAANKEAKEVLPDDQVKLTVKVNDQFGNPIEKAKLANKVRWVVEDGRAHTNIVDDVTDGDNELTFTATEAGNLKISAYIGNGEKVTYQVTIGAKKLATIGTVTFANAKNHEEATSTELAPNPGAVLKASDVKFEITSLPKGVTKEDITLVAVQGDKEATKDKVYVKATTKVAGEYKFRAYVGTAVDAEGAIASAESTITTTVNQAVNSIEVEPFAENELTAGKEVIKKVTFKNKHGEVVSVNANDLGVARTANMNVKLYDADSTLIQKVDGNYPATPVAKLGFIGAAEGTDTVTLVAGSKSVALNLTTQKAAAIKTVDLGQDITTGVIAGQINGENAKNIYAPITVKDNYGNAVIPAADQIGAEAGKLRVSAVKIAGDTTNWTAPEVAIKYYKLDKDGKIEIQDAKNADTVGIALEINANGCKNTADKIATVTLSNGEAGDKEIKDTLNVSVKAVRKLAKLDVTTVSNTVGLNGKSTIKVTPVDQYGNFKTFDIANANVEISDATVLATVNAGGNVAVKKVDKDGKVTENVKNMVGYTFEVNGLKSGSADVKVKDTAEGSKIEGKVSMTVTPAATVVKSIKLVNDNINADGTYKYKVAKNTVDVTTFGIKAYDVNGNEVAINPADVIWTSSDVAVATVDADGKVTTKAIGADADKTVTITASVGLVKQSITLTVSKDAAAMVPGTVKVTAPEKVDADATKAGIQISLDGKTEDGEVAEGQENAGTITLTFKGSDQFGAVADIVEANTPVHVISFNPEVATVGAWNNVADTLTITPVAVGSTTVRVTVGTQDILLDVNVTDKNVNVVATKAVEALEAAAKKDLTVKANIDAAKAAKTAADIEVAKLHGGAVYDALNARVTTANNAITAAEAAANEAAALVAINAGNATEANYTAAGINSVTAENLSDVNTAVAAAKNTKGSALTKAEIQSAVDKVVAKKANEVAVAAAKTALTLSINGSASGATAEIVLPSTGSETTTITWKEGSTDKTGTYTTEARPGSGDAKTVTLTATITKGDGDVRATTTKTFTVTIPVTGTDISVVAN